MVIAKHFTGYWIRYIVCLIAPFYILFCLKVYSTYAFKNRSMVLKNETQRLNDLFVLKGVQFNNKLNKEATRHNVWLT